MLAEEGTIANGTVGDASALQALLGGEPNLACGRTGRDDHCARLDRLAADIKLVRRRHRIAREAHGSDVLGTQRGAKALSLRAHLSDQFRTHDAVFEARVVVDFRGDHQLAASGVALDHDGREVTARGVQRSRIAGRSAADDRKLMNFVVGHVCGPLPVALYLVLQTPPSVATFLLSRIVRRCSVSGLVGMLSTKPFLAAFTPDGFVVTDVPEERADRLAAEWAKSRSVGWLLAQCVAVYGSDTGAPLSSSEAA